MQINLTKAQSKFFASKSKFCGFIGGVGSGKTFVGSLYAFNKSQTEPYALGFIGANTYRQLHNSTLESLFSFLSEINCDFEYNQNKGWLNINKARVLCGSLENYDVYRGIQIGWGWIDEGRDTREDAWKVLIGRLRDPKAKRYEMRVTSTPAGYNWLYDYFNGNKKSQEYEAIFSSSMDNPHLPPGYLETLKESYDEKVYQQEVMGKFINITHGQVYYSFSREKNVVNTIKSSKFPLIIGMDFNINPMSAVIAQIYDDSVNVIDELSIMSSDTREMAKAIKEKYGSSWHVIPDSTGKRKQTSSAGFSDHQILREEGFTVINFQNPFRLDRYNTVNNLLEKQRLKIDPRCKKLIRDLEQVSYKEGSNVPDDSDSTLTHISDALGYLCWHCFPILKPQNSIGMVNRNG